MGVSRAVSAADALFFDERGRVLLVEPTYKDTWEIPGGMIEDGETPSEACRREVAEELGLRVDVGRLLVVDWAPNPMDGDKVLFVFDGGVLEPARVDAITLPANEIASYEFVDPALVADRLIPRLARRVAAAVRAHRAGVTSYLEQGVERQA